jgi:hypothetical protein
LISKCIENSIRTRKQGSTCDNGNIWDFAT